MDLEKRFEHQQREYDLHKYDRARAYLWQMRTGKTRMAVESVVALCEALEIGGALVIAPNGVHRQWAEDQIRRWGGPRNSAFAWRFSNLRNSENFAAWIRSASDQSAFMWLCVNTESIIRPEVWRAIKTFKKAVGQAMLIVDESHHFARPGAKRTARARRLGRDFEYARILTGTAIENSPLQAFSQFEILERAALGHSTFGGFKGEFAEIVLAEAHDRRFPKITGYRNLDALKTRMAKYSSVVLRSDCEDLPPLQMDERVAEMTERQWDWWRTVKEKEIERAEELGQERVFAGGAALVKLQQIEGGFWRRDDGKIERLCDAGENPKILILLDETQQYDGQVICWFEFTHEIIEAGAALHEAGVEHSFFHGKMPDRARYLSLARFKRGSTRVLLAQPRAGGEGRDMSGAGKMLWFSHTPDAVVRSQANERATAMRGQSVQVVDILGPVGRYFRDMTSKKSLIADDVSRRGLRAVLEEIEKERR